MTATDNDRLQPPKLNAKPTAPTARRSVSFGPTSAEEDNRTGEGSRPLAGMEMTTPGGGATGVKRNVSASSSNGPPGSVNMTPSNSSQGALKPALKAGTERKRLPSPALYQHSDPILRRLRLVDDKGQAIHLKNFFRGVKVVAFYFSSQWAGQPLKEYHDKISEFAREHPNEFKVIYVSVDVDEQWYKAGVKGQPWVSMVWNDGSSLPSPAMANNGAATVGDTSKDEDAPPQLYNDENFLLAQENDIDESLSRSDTSGEAYLRPFSRVHLASKLNIIAAPTVCIYHLERQKMLDWNVRMARLDRHRRDETWSRWKRGESAKSFGLTEALAHSPVTMLLASFVALYWIAILVGGQDYNFLRHAFERLDGSARSALPKSTAAAAEALGRMTDTVQEHVEF